MPAAKVYVGLDDAAGATRPSDAVLLPSTLALAGRHAVSLIQERAGAGRAGEERREEADREAALLQHRSRQAGEAGGSAGAAGRGAKKPSWFKM